jgi:hypothetical protein
MIATAIPTIIATKLVLVGDDFTGCGCVGGSRITNEMKWVVFPTAK